MSCFSVLSKLCGTNNNVIRLPVEVISNTVKTCLRLDSDGMEKYHVGQYVPKEHIDREGAWRSYFYALELKVLIERYKVEVDDSKLVDIIYYLFMNTQHSFNFQSNF